VLARYSGGTLMGQHLVSQVWVARKPYAKESLR
jgi:hypothetical protein